MGSDVSAGLRDWPKAAVCASYSLSWMGSLGPRAGPRLRAAEPCRLAVRGVRPTWSGSGLGLGSVVSGKGQGWFWVRVRVGGVRRTSGL